MKDSTDEVKPVVRYKWEYNNFLEYVKKHKIARALLYAKTLGIDRRTMSNWVHQPELREALAEAMDDLVDNMERAGKNDWRMYLELMKRMGLDDGETIKLADPDGNDLKTALVKFVDEKKE